MLRSNPTLSSLAIPFILLLSISLVGCGESNEPKGPEMGSIEAYLEEHPEEAVDDPDEFEDEDAEMEASS